jgi:hypothetical protein
MTAKKTRQASRGELLVQSILAEMAELGVVPTSTEDEVLVMASTLADRLAELEEIISDEGLMITTSRGDSKINPAATEHRMITVALARVLGSISFSDVTSPATGKKTNPTKARSARARWRQRDEAG